MLLNRTVFLAVLAAIACPAQESRGTISGAVTDATGAAAAGAKVIATEIRTGTKVQTVSEPTGQYTLPFLASGDYQGQHHAAESSQTAGHDPHVDGHTLDVDAGQGGQVAIVGDGTHRLAQAGAGQEQRGKRRDHQRHGDGHRLAWRKADEADGHDLGLRNAVHPDLPAGDQVDRVANDQAQADGDERDGDGAAAAQRSEQAEVGDQRRRPPSRACR